MLGSETVARAIELMVLQKIWDSGLALSAWLAARLRPDQVQPTFAGPSKEVGQILLDGESGEDSISILELGKSALTRAFTQTDRIGSGTGLVSIALRRSLQARCPRRSGIRITATDLGESVSYAHYTLTLTSRVGNGPHARELRVEHSRISRRSIFRGSKRAD